jgi:hypothetical protein
MQKFLVVTATHLNAGHTICIAERYSYVLDNVVSTLTIEQLLTFRKHKIWLMRQLPAILFSFCYINPLAYGLLYP